MIVFALKCINFEKTFLSSSPEKSSIPAAEASGDYNGDGEKREEGGLVPCRRLWESRRQFSRTVLSAFIFDSELLFRRSRDPSFLLPRQDDPEISEAVIRFVTVIADAPHAAQG